MSLLQNLVFAEMAVKFAEQHLRGGSSNRTEDIVHALQKRLRDNCFDRDQVMDNLDNPYTYRQMPEIYMQRVADINSARDERRKDGRRLHAASIIAGGIGNCFEHSVLACHFLRSKNVPSYMVDTDDETNHVFVVIGVQGGLNGQTIDVDVRLNANPGLPLSTNDSVVCDPWYHEWFGIRDSWGTKMHLILSTTSKRENNALPNVIPLTFTDGTLVT